MEVSRVRALRGPNLWCRQTAIEAVVSCTEAESVIRDMDVFETRLRARFPDIDILKPPGQDRPNSMAHSLAYAALRLQNQAGCPVTFSRTSPLAEPGMYQVIVEYSEEEVGRLAFDLARALCVAALLDAPFDLADALARLRDVNEDVRLGPSTGSIVHAAMARQIPFRRLTQGSVVQFGWGSKQRRIQAAETDGSSAVADAKNVARKSSSIVERISGARKTNRRPSRAAVMVKLLRSAAAVSAWRGGSIASSAPMTKTNDSALVA